MNERNVKAIKVMTQPTNGDEPRELTYEVVQILKLNDLRFDMDDRRRVGSVIGDGWRKDTDQRDVLNEHVDSFIERLDREDWEYTLLFEKDLQEA